MLLFHGGKMPADCALTIGKFESLHLGHRRLINEMTRRARDRGLLSAVMTFNPHPRVLLGEPSYKPIFTPRERACILASMGVDCLLEYPFDHTFMEMPPADFGRLLFTALRCRLLTVGEGFRFGKGRAGSAADLQKAAALWGAEAAVIPRLTHGGTAVSTSAIREKIMRGRLPEAARLLGFHYFIMGGVVKGKQIGRTLGFPTVNIQAEERFLPPDGVYATRTHFDGKEYRSITNIGVRPTVETTAEKARPNMQRNGENALVERKPEPRRTVETFLMDFDGDLYGEELKTEFISYIRPERKFESMDALREQIKRDINFERSDGVEPI